MGEFLKVAVKTKVNILVSVVRKWKENASELLFYSTPAGERIVTIEDMAELRFTMITSFRCRGATS